MISDVPETWKPIIGYQGLYEVGSQGHVRSLVMPTGGGIHTRKSPLILKPKTKRSGYLEVGLNNGGVKRMHYVHSLVIEAFSGKRPEGMEGGHDDGNKKNNAATNLVWITHAKNMQMAVDQESMERGENRYNSILTEELVYIIRKEYSFRKVTYKMLANKYGVTVGAITNMMNGKTWRHVKEE